MKTFIAGFIVATIGFGAIGQLLDSGIDSVKNTLQSIHIQK